MAFTLRQRTASWAITTAPATALTWNQGDDNIIGLHDAITGITSSPGGATTQVQYNNAGAFSGSPGMVWAEATSGLTISGYVNISGNTNTGGQILSGGTDISTLWGGGGGTPGGASTQIQFNNAGAFSGSTGFTWAQSATTLTVKGDAIFDTSGNTTNPIFKILGSSGELFTVTDSLTGELFAVNDSSGLPVLRVMSDDTVLMGNVGAPSLNSTSVKNVSAGQTYLYDILSSGYTSAYFDYNIAGNGSARAGNIMSIWSGTSLNYTETSTSDIGDTSPVTLSVAFSGNNTSLIASATTNNWVIKTIVRSI